MTKPKEKVVRYMTVPVALGVFSLLLTCHYQRSGLRSQSEDLKHKVHTKRTGVSFIPFPHRSLSSGMDAACTWSATKNKTSEFEELFSNYDHLDLIQSAAFEEGICVPDEKGFRLRLHVFSTNQAIECLSSKSQGRDIQVVVTGDSYNKQLFIGLADILLGNPSNDEIGGAEERNKVLNQTVKGLQESLAQNSSFPNVTFVCYTECYGLKSHEKPFPDVCSKCINPYTKSHRSVAAFVGAGVHMFLSYNRSIPGFLHDVKGFLDKAEGVVFNSVPSYQVEKIPPKYRTMHNGSEEQMYWQTLQYVSPQNPSHPFLDFFQLTKSCFMDNCASDGGHRARYVNRWKAQLLLNTICNVNKS